MAEFQEVMRQAKRMCEANCEECPLSHTVGNICPIAVTGNDEIAEIENIVMNWAAEHPEPRYPSWNRWFRETFPNSVFATSPCPNTFCRICDQSRYRGEAECHKCKSDPIPADIAEKLGIKPVEVSSV